MARDAAQHEAWFHPQHRRRRKQHEMYTGYYIDVECIPAISDTTKGKAALPRPGLPA